MTFPEILESVRRMRKPARQLFWFHVAEIAQSNKIESPLAALQTDEGSEDDMEVTEAILWVNEQELNTAFQKMVDGIKEVNKTMEQSAKKKAKPVPVKKNQERKEVVNQQTGDSVILPSKKTD